LRRALSFCISVSSFTSLQRLDETMKQRMGKIRIEYAYKYVK
jgi:hypothetical protein